DDNMTDDADDYLRKAVNSMIGEVRSNSLKVNGIDLDETFEKFCDECENEF
ncbi:15241_t:CDS:1, partial [Acaulospora colombiana]